MTAITTRGAVFERVMREMLHADPTNDDDPLTAFFNKSGIASVKTILELPTKALAKPWVYKDASGNDLEVPVAKKTLVWIFVDYHNHLSNAKGAAVTYEECVRLISRTTGSIHMTLIVQ